MKTKILSLSLLAALFAAVSCTKEPVIAPANETCEADYTSHPGHAAYQDALNYYASNSPAPGSVIGVKEQGQPEWIGADGFSNLEYNTAFLPCTQFRCGSITKVFTAVVIMQLIDEEQLTLESTLDMLLPEISGRIPSAELITVKQLLNHSSGLKQPTDDDINYQLSLINNPDFIGGMDYKSRLEHYVYDKPLMHVPGTESYYSNAGYWVLALIIEKITGKSIAENIEERITAPLNLSSTYLTKQDDHNVARGYNFSGNLLKDVTIWDRADSDGDPAAGLVSNAHDLLVFGEALFTGNLVSDSSLALMKETTSFPSCNGDCGYGLGIESWQTAEHSGYGKNGSSLGVDANLIFFPDQSTTIVIFSNYGGGNNKDVIDLLLDI
ncbi:MAG: beta-lactamase family protein [Chitinophagales bacterium]|nr:beta-lactamase family protein [Chitinophagales bacterium]